jgi:hypothetical protein
MLVSQLEIEAMSTKCDDAEKSVLSKRIKVASFFGILLFLKYGFWSYVANKKQR